MSYAHNFHTYKTLTGHICECRVPLVPGENNDDMILLGALTSWLKSGEQVEADLGYRRSAQTQLNYLTM